MSLLLVCAWVSICMRVVCVFYIKTCLTVPAGPPLKFNLLTKPNVTTNWGISARERKKEREIEKFGEREKEREAERNEKKSLQ